MSGDDQSFVGKSGKKLVFLIKYTKNKTYKVAQGPTLETLPSKI